MAPALFKRAANLAEKFIFSKQKIKSLFLYKTGVSGFSVFNIMFVP